MANFDYFSAVLGAMMGCIGLLVVLSVLIGKTYNERSLYALALMGALGLAYLVLQSASLLQVNHSNSIQTLGKLLYSVGLALSMLLPVWVLGQSGGSKRPAQVLYFLSASSAPVAMFIGHSWGSVLGGAFSMTWLIWGIWYLARNWQQGKPWIFWLAGGQFMLLAAWLGKFVMELGVVDANASVLLAWSALHLMLFTVFSYLALVWRSRLLSHERLKTQSNLAYDPLTGLAKSSEFISAYHRVSLRSESLAYTSGILVLRAGNLSEFSQSMGAENNELGLLWIARILRRCARPQDLVARVSEHSFAVLMDGFEPSMDITSLATKIVSNGLRLQIANAEGVGLKFNMVTMPFSGKDALPSQVLVRMLEKLDMCTDGDKAIHMIKPDSLHDAKSTLATAPAELLLTP